MTPRVLAIAGTDCSGGAGLQADLSAIAAMGGRAAIAVTAVTVQDRRGLHGVHPLGAPAVAAQIACVLADPGVDAVKTGMLVDRPTIAAIMAALAGNSLPLVVDPVLAASSGGRLLDDEGLASLHELFSLATLITPNAPEAALLCGHPVEDLDAMRRAAAILLRTGPQAVLIKGGHVPGEVLTDLLLTAAGETVFRHKRLARPAIRGTGCTLASAIATGLGRAQTLPAAVASGIAHVERAIIAAGSEPLSCAGAVNSGGPGRFEVATDGQECG